MSEGGLVVTRINDTIPAVPPPENIISLRRWDGTSLVGRAAVAAVNWTNQWDAALKRYSRHGATNASNLIEKIDGGIEPRSIVDPRYPKSGVVVRVRDTVHLAIDHAPTANINNFGRVSFGLRAGPLAGTSANQGPFIGFRADLFDNNWLAPVWSCDYVNWDSSVRRSIATNIAVRAIHDLTIELSGPDQTIRWYIDGNLVSAFKPTANDAGGQSPTAPTSWTVTSEVVASTLGATSNLTFSIHLGAGPMTTALYHDA